MSSLNGIFSFHLLQNGLGNYNIVFHESLTDTVLYCIRSVILCLLIFLPFGVHVRFFSK